MSFFRGIALALGLASGLAGCGDPPGPFTRTAPPANPLLDPGLRGGLVVPPVGGAPDAQAAEALAAATIRALRDAEVPALSPAEADQIQPAPRRPALHGQVRPSAAGGMAAEWVLRRATGEEEARFRSEHAPDQSEPALIAAIAQAAARAVHEHRIDSEGVPPAVESLPAVAIVAIDGADGSGPQALHRSLEHHLQQAGLTVADNVGDAAALILGALAATPSPGRPGGPPADLLQVTWTVLRPDGREIGTLRQANEVPRGTLQGPWGDLAFLIAEAATPGIVELLQQAATADRMAHAESGAAR